MLTDHGRSHYESGGGGSSGQTPPPPPWLGTHLPLTRPSLWPDTPLWPDPPHEVAQEGDPTMNRMTHVCKNITFPYTPYAVGNKLTSIHASCFRFPELAEQ